ncbi:MAG: metallophosphoesterase [Pirellulaceae bacterium]|nr:MAG: metallophosphoesterase [Pirellulaceae bacterium]
MVRFLHTADWQIGMKAARVGSKADQVRQERLRAAERVIETARKEDVDFVVVTGDLFEHNAVDRSLIQRIVDILGRFPKPVFLIPGNHDPYEPGSVWHHAAWRTYPQLHVLIEPQPTEVGDVVLYPCPVHDKFARRDPTGWIDHRDSSKIGIGLAHGSVEGVVTQDATLPIARQAADRSRLDFLALGHWHSVSLFESAGGAPRMAYCGTHEPTGFGERQSGFVLLVEIARPGAPPEVQPRQTGRLQWHQEDCSVTSDTDLELLVDKLNRWERPEETLLSVKVEGLLTPNSGVLLNRIEELIQARFFWAELDATRLRAGPQDATWIENLPAGMLREVAARLLRLADPACTERPEGATPQIASMALSELYRFVSESES